MLTFEMRKTKKLSMPVLVEGIQQEMLNFKFIIESNGVEYGFPAERGGDNVSFIIPPLDRVIEELEEGVYNAKLEVSAITEGDRGFFMQPWGEQIRVKQSVSVEVKPVKEEDSVEEKIEEKVKLKISSIFTEEEGDHVEEECNKKKDVKKNNKMREKFF